MMPSDAPPPYDYSATHECPDLPHSSSNSLATVESPDDQVGILAAQYREHIPHSTTVPLLPTPPLARPILIPQAYVASIMQPPAPFLRAYPPVLGSRNIPPALFLAIIDTLNICLAPAPPLQALNLVGQGLGLVPHHWAQAASAGIGLAAGVGTAAVRITRLKRFLERVNQDVFAPQGLRMEVLKDEDVMRELKLEQSTGGEAMGASHTPGLSSSDPKKRMEQLAPYIAPVSFDVPPPSQQIGVLDRISAKQTAARLSKREQDAQKRQEKRDEEMHKLAGKYDRPHDHHGTDGESVVSSYRGEEHEPARVDEEAMKINAKADAALRNAEGKKVRDIEKKRAKELGKMEKEHRKSQDKYGKAMRKIQEKGGKQEEKDMRKVEKLQWIRIQSLSS